MHKGLSALMRQCLEATVGELSEEFRGVFSRETVARYVESSYEDVGEGPTAGPNFLPVIIARFAREQLWAAGQADGKVEKALPEVLFVCERNAGRSKLASAFVHHFFNGWVGVRSAGSHPEDQVDPVVVEAMGELGVDVTLEFPEPLTDDVLRAADVVVTLGCGDACPVYPGKRYEDWPVEDPVGQPLEVVRRIRYDLYHRVWELLETLVHTNALIAIHGPSRDQP